jgi:beta-phosphoglucomutase-like phosphatase (HAD superfamily)
VPTVPTVDLVIFDCDGVLVDSERLIVRTEAAILSRLGWPLTPEEVIDRFVGRSAPYMHHEVERHLGPSTGTPSSRAPMRRSSQPS